jgi:hypothetical protein
MNIIGIAGRAGAGKDTAASTLVTEFGFIKVSLADPLKRICKEVFAFTDEQLWGPSECRNAPDPRFRRRPSGYDAKGRPIDRCACPEGSFRGPEDYRDHLPCPKMFAGPEFLTPRHALQSLGTEWGRSCYPDVWVDYVIKTARLVLEPHDDGDANGWYARYDARSGLCGREFPSNRARGVVIPDVRFPNEVAAIRAAGGKIWLIERPCVGLEGEAGAHISEHAIDEFDPDGRIVNYGRLEDLAAIIRTAMR